MAERTRDERIESYYQESARDLAERVVDLEDGCAGYRSEVMAEGDRSDRRYLDAMARGDRYRLAWISARRRAADEANLGMEAMDFMRDEMAKQEATHTSFVAELRPLMTKRMADLRRAHAFVHEVRRILGWTHVDGNVYTQHLPALHDAVQELQSATEDERPFVDRIGRRAARGDFDEDYEPGDLRKSTDGAPRLEYAGAEEDGSTVWRLANGSDVVLPPVRRGLQY